MIILGVDVGLTGAIAFLDRDGRYIGVHDLPVTMHGKAKWIDPMPLIECIREHRVALGLRGESPAHAFVEQIHAMPKLGTVAANLKGMTLGSTLAALQVAGVSIELVSPNTWKAALGLQMPKASDKEKKDASLARARLLYPTAELDRQKDHGRAEALLIAHWAHRHALRKAAA